MATFSIWEGEGITLKRGDGPPMYPDGKPMEANPVLIKVFRATSWNEACQVEYDRHGWGEYDADDGWEEIGPDEE